MAKQSAQQTSTLALKCPRTGDLLQPLFAGEAKLDFCNACGGVFVDYSEIKNLNEDDFTSSDLMYVYADNSIDHKQRVKCPKHPDVVMIRRFFSPLHGVEIDECPACRGIWFDIDELYWAHKEEPDETARKINAQNLAKKIESSVEFLEHKKELHQFKTQAASFKSRVHFYTSIIDLIGSIMR